MALKKASKRIVISDESVNSKGFRTLTAGIDVSQFNRNPLFLWMHNRPTKGTKDDLLPIGIVSDLRLENNTLTGLPQFDDKDVFAMKLYHKFEDGILRMCSPGLTPVKFSDDKALMLQGQKFPTLINSILTEVSLADIGSNNSALAYKDVVLYDQNEQVIEVNEMTILKLSQALNNPISTNNAGVDIGELSSLLGLDKSAGAKDVLAAISKLKNDIAAAQSNLSVAQKQQLSANASSLIQQAFNSNKITASQKELCTKLAIADYVSTKSLLDAIPGKPYLSETGKTQQEDEQDELNELNELNALSNEQLWEQDKFERLKQLDLNAYTKRYKEFFKKESAL